MENTTILAGIVILGFTLSSCKKCAECHYDGLNGIIEVGEYCGDDLKNIEKSGVTIDGEIFEVHCHDH